MAFESWIDRQIREAMERGAFDDLPGAGKPLEGLGTRDEDWWVKGLMERERLKGADVASAMPTSLLLRRQRERLQEDLADVGSEGEAREIIEALNARIRESHHRRVDGPPVFTATVDVEAELATWRRRR